MNEDKMMPEEKLLKIIENPIIAKTTANQQPANPVKRFPAGFIVAADYIQTALNNFKDLSLRKVNIATVSFAAIITIYCLFDIISMNRAIGAREAKIRPSADSYAEVDMLKQAVIPTHELISSAKKRNIFTSSATPAEATFIQDSQSISDLKLVGIIWSESPQAMIEDTKGAKTYLLSAGEKIGNLRIKQIFKEKVVIASDEWERELR